MYKPRRRNLRDELRYLRRVLEDHSLLELKEDEAQSMLDLLQELADLTYSRALILKTIFRLSKASGRSPQCLIIKNVEFTGKRPFGGGGFGDVWKGSIGRSETNKVICAIKVARGAYYEMDHCDLHEYRQNLDSFKQEAILWRQLKHPNVLPFLGMHFRDGIEQAASLVSPFMANGNLPQFLKRKSSSEVAVPTLIYDIASGLEYLHQENFVHGDLKDLNILLREDCRACISDFGLSRLGVTLGMQASTIRHGGTQVYMAPEILDGGASSKEGDVYAYGVLVYVILSKVYGLPQRADRRKSQPRPANLPEDKDLLWTLIHECWMEEPLERPTASVIKRRVTLMNVGVVSAPHWDDSLYTSIRSDMDFTTEEIAVLSRFMYRADAQELTALKLTSVLDNAKSVERPMDQNAAQEDLKEVVQRLRANDFLNWKGHKAQKLLDQFHRASEVAKSPTRERILEKMNELSRKSNKLPSCLWIQHEVTKLDSHAQDETGGYAAVWRGRIGNNPEIVALKIIKRHVEGEVEKLLGELIRETLVWRQLEHNNIVPFKGAYLFNEEPREFCLVSPWMENGNLANFVQNDLDITPELQYKLALGVANGLAYLHSKQITHGDIKGTNILIDSENNARITDFGLSRIATAESTQALGPLRWQAPELLSGKQIPNESSDVYAYGCIYAKTEPFPDVADPMIPMKVMMEKERPERVQDAFPDVMWNLMSACWAEAPAERPAASKVADYLKRGSKILKREKATALEVEEVEERLAANDFLNWKGEKAQKLLDQFHRASEVVTGSKQDKILDKMNVLSKRSNLLPDCLWIQHGVTKLDPQAVDETGGYATVWRGKIGENSEIVALKIMKRNVEGEVEKLLGELIRETLVWWQLKHENVVPFIGAYLFNEEPREFCLVSPWMENGNLAKFVKTSSGITPELQYKLALDTASGLAYLHGQGITHGDIKGNNILIDDEKNARITDFGLSRIANATSTAMTSTSWRNALGPIRWQAPELLLEETGLTPASDVYAYGYPLQIYAKTEPFHGDSDTKVIRLVTSQSKRPERVEGAFPDPMWKLMCACWEEEPAKRPVASAVVERLNKDKAAWIKIKKGSKIGVSTSARLFH